MVDLSRRSVSLSIASRMAFAIVAGLTISAGTSTASAQLPSETGNYTPFDQNLPTGVTAQWSAMRQRSRYPYFQPVKIVLPTTGQVTLFSRSDVEPVKLAAPASARVAVGSTYRLRLSDMPEYPGVELFPTIELLDRLHPPAGKEEQFPVPIDFTAEEIELAVEGRLVTKVIYVEQPQMAMPAGLREDNAIRTIAPSQNLLAEADKRGRPMVLVRLGSRAPDAISEDRAFFGPGSPIRSYSNERLGGAGRTNAQ